MPEHTKDLVPAEVGESFAAARQPGPAMARRVDCSSVDTVETRVQDTERRMMAALRRWCRHKGQLPVVRVEIEKLHQNETTRSTTITTTLTSNTITITESITSSLKLTKEIDVPIAEASNIVRNGYDSKNVQDQGQHKQFANALTRIPEMQSL
ncbi:hypothetical protein Tco_0845573 [Tanacetum coccineum]